MAAIIPGHYFAYFILEKSQLYGYIRNTMDLIISIQKDKMALGAFAPGAIMF